MSVKPVRVSFVCLGNICRSPTAEAIMRKLIKDAGLEERVLLDSAGLGSWHVGKARDPRSAEVGERRGIPLAGLARQWKAPDFARFDYVIAMDRANRDGLRQMAPDADARSKVHLLRSFDPAAPNHADVPDPYEGGPAGFELVFDQCLVACEGLLAHIRKVHKIY